MAGLEWFVAWRHLRDAERRIPRTLVVGAAVILVAAILWVVGQKVRGQPFNPDDPFAFVARGRWARTGAWMVVGGKVGVAAGGVIAALGTMFFFFPAFTAFAIFAVFLATFAPIVTLSIMSGFESDLKAKIRGAKADVVVERNADEPFTGWEALVPKLRALPGVVGVTPFIEAEVMIMSGQTPAGLVLRGIDPATAGDVLDVGRKMREGRLEMLAKPELVEPPRWKSSFSEPGAELPPRGRPAPSDGADADVNVRKLPTIILGEELFRRILRVFVSDVVQVTCPACQATPVGLGPRQREFRVAGHFYTGMYEFDSKLGYITLAEAQRFLGMPGEITGLDLRTTTPEHARAAADAAQAMLGSSYTVRAWEDLNRALFLALKVEKIAMFVVLTLIGLVASFSIISNLFMLVTQKGREVAILKAMGTRDASILRVFLIEGLYIGILGLIPGLLFGVGACLAMERWGLRLPSEIYYIERLPVVMREGEIVTIGLIVLGLCALATIGPALVASRLRPVEGLRYE